MFRTILISFWLFACIAFIVVKGVLPAWEDERSDFSNYYTSAVLLAEGELISQYYDNDWFTEKAVEVGLKDGAKFAPFPPITAYLYLPLTVFYPLQAKRVWLVGNVLLLIVLVIQLKSFTSFKFWQVVILLSLFFIPIASNIRLGQTYLLICSLLIVVLTVLKKEKYAFGGIILGTLAALKYFPIVYLVYGFSKINKKLLWGIFAAVVVCLLVPSLFNDTTVYPTFLNEFLRHANGDISGQGQFSYNFQSIDALLANLFIYDAQWNTNVVVDLPWLKTVFKALFTLLISYFSVKMFLKSTEKTKQLAYGGIIIGAALIIPASASYHLLLLIPAFFLVFQFCKEKGEIKFLIGLSIMVLTTCSLLPHHLPELNFSSILNTVSHFPRLYSLIIIFTVLYLKQKTLLKQSSASA